MSIKIEQIKGLLPERCNKSNTFDGSKDLMAGFNIAIDTISPRRISLNRERTAKKMYTLLYPQLALKEHWEDMRVGNHIKTFCYEWADAIIKDQSELLEYVEEGE